MLYNIEQYLQFFYSIDIFLYFFFAEIFAASFLAVTTWLIAVFLAEEYDAEADDGEIAVDVEVDVKISVSVIDSVCGPVRVSMFISFFCSFSSISKFKAGVITKDDAGKEDN